MLNKLITFLGDSRVNFHRAAVWRDGQYGEHTFTAACPCQNIYSISKSIMATIVGLAAERGILKLTDPITGYFEDKLTPGYDKRLDGITIEHLLTQTMGMSDTILFEGDRYVRPERDWIKLALSRKIDCIPGKSFHYDNATFYLLSCIIERRTGMTADLYLRKHLFDAMDIRDFSWERCPFGHVVGATGLYMRLYDLVQFGRLYLGGGVYKGKRLLREEWVQSAVKPYPNEGGTGYGYSFWTGKSGDYRCTGAHNQLVYISSRFNTVIAVQGFDDRLKLDKLVLDILEENEKNLDDYISV